MAKPPRSGLTAREKRFCEEYIKDLKIVEAAKRAGFSEKTGSAAVQGNRIMKHPEVKAYIAELAAARAQRTQIDADTVLRELLRLATVDVTRAFDERGWLKDLKDIPEDVRRAIAGIETQELFQGEGEQRSIIGVTRKVKFYDKIRPLELLGKHVKLFAERVEHSGPDGKPIETRAVDALSDEQLNARIKALLGAEK